MCRFRKILIIPLSFLLLSVFSIHVSSASTADSEKASITSNKSSSVNTTDSKKASSSEIANDNYTLGMITEQRAYLESLKLQVAIQEETNKFEELLTPKAVSMPTQSLIDSLAVPRTSSGQNLNETTSSNVVNTNSPSLSASQLLFVQGVDEGNLTANIRLNGKLISLKQGQFYKGNRVKITREKVTLGKTILTLE